MGQYFNAARPGTCAGCGGEVKVGEPIYWTRPWGVGVGLTYHFRFRATCAPTSLPEDDAAHRRRVLASSYAECADCGRAVPADAQHVRHLSPESRIWLCDRCRANY